MKTTIPLIVGMMLVTYIPRMIPLVFLNEKPIRPFIAKILQYIPYTALSALIIKGIIDGGENRAVSLIGLFAAGIVAWFGGTMVLSVLTAILSSYLLLVLFG